MATVIIVPGPGHVTGRWGQAREKTSLRESGLFLISRGRGGGSGVGGKRGFLGRHQHLKLLLIIRVVKPLKGRREEAA